MRKSKGDYRLIEAVSDHVEKYFGKIDFVLHEKDSPYVHIDVNVVVPTRKRPYFVLVTSGMSELPMPVPKGASDGRYAELAICLPKTWRMNKNGFQKEENWWPIRLVIDLARYPHKHKTWFYAGHSVVEDPASPYARNTRMNSALLLKPKKLSAKSHVIHVRGNKHALLWGVFPLHPEEMKFKLDHGSNSLEELLDRRNVTELLNPKRKSVVKAT